MSSLMRRSVRFSVACVAAATVSMTLSSGAVGSSPDVVGVSVLQAKPDWAKPRLTTTATAVAQNEEYRLRITSPDIDHFEGLTLLVRKPGSDRWKVLLQPVMPRKDYFEYKRKGKWLGTHRFRVKVDYQYDQGSNYTNSVAVTMTE